MRTYPFTLPGYESHAFTLYPGDLVSSLKIYCDGQPMKRSWGKYKTMLPDGEEIELKLKFSLDLFNPDIVFKGKVIPVVPSFPAGQRILIYLPLILVFVGGAIGGLLGGVGAYQNLVIFRGKSPVALKIVLSLAVTLAAIIFYGILAALIHGYFQ